MEIDRRRILRRVAQGAAVGAAGALAAAGRPRRVSASPAGPATSAPTGPAPAAFGAGADPLPAPWKPPAPPIVPRTLWQNDQLPRPPQAQYDHTVRAIFVHHTASGDSYRPQDVPDIIRSIYIDHRESRGWDDIGYQFLVDRYGTIYEGRLGGVDQAVVGAQAQGFNHETVGVAVIGTYKPGVQVPAPVVEAIAQLAAWKLGSYGVDPHGRSELTSTSNESRYPTGTSHLFNAVSGHRDACFTQCPGDAIYAVLPQVIDRAASLLRAAPPARPVLPIDAFRAIAPGSVKSPDAQGH
ncbi:N-acetylmuramoyl-L-alanine amidase [Kitasatospora sp. NPDC052896]|uniref:N-acetylmuramoyl-L-alanine amidase n=1 Tax=Kitasatospora sp. NPDC052896 TaxID=3364061 RepID=UPI0037CACC5B